MATRKNLQFHPTLEVLEDRTLPSSFKLIRPVGIRGIPARVQIQRAPGPVFQSQNTSFTTSGISGTGFSSTVARNFQTRETGINGPVVPQGSAPAAQLDPNSAGFDSFFIAFGTGRPSGVR